MFVPCLFPYSQIFVTAIYNFKMIIFLFKQSVLLLSRLTKVFLSSNCFSDHPEKIFEIERIVC